MSNHVEFDLNREERTGFPEVVYGAGKPLQILENLLNELVKQKDRALVTKLDSEKGLKLSQRFKPSFFDEISGIFVAGEFPDTLRSGAVAVLSAGTSDLYLVNEIYYTLKFFGIEAAKYQDIGVAGLHRLTDKVSELKKYKVLIVVAGFEGALPTVTGGLLPQPVIAVPSSVGYGVSAGGAAALNAMLAGCANGITVVNIDNGYGAAMAALRILRTFGEIDE